MKSNCIKDCHAAFGEYIKNNRVRKGLSQSDVAGKLEVSQPYYSRIEAGKRDVDLAFAFKICDVIGVDMRDFINKYM